MEDKCFKESIILLVICIYENIRECFKLVLVIEFRFMCVYNLVIFLGFY